MPILHKNITAETDIHNPKWFSNANNGDYAWKNEQGNLESIDELLLPAALNFVDASVAPPTSNANDIYVLSSGGSVHAGWGSVSLQDWVRYDGAAWNSITPQKSSLCYNENTDKLLSFDGTAWAALGGDNIYTADGTVSGARLVDLDNNKLTFDVGTLASGASNTIGLRIDGSNIFYGGGSGSSPLFLIDSDLGNVLNVNSGGFLISTSDYTNSIAQFKNRAGTKGLYLKNNVSDIACTQFRHLFTNSDTSDRIDQAVTSSYQQWLMAKDNDINHWIRNGDSAAQASFFINGITGRGFNVGGGNSIGAEAISLQGSTLVSDKFEIQTTTAGMLMPRLTTAQMNAISSPDTHLLVFNTDLNALYRYNGSAWVAMSAGYGIISINDSSGNPTFYADLAAATTAVSTGGTITIHSDIALTAQWTINKHLTVNMNGYTISFNSAGTDDTIYVNYAATQQQVFQFTGGGRIVRTGGTSSQLNSLAMHYLCNDFLDMGSTQFHSDFGTAIYIQSAKQSRGGFIWAEDTAVRTALAKLIDCNIFSNNGDGLFSNSGSNDEVIRCFIQAPNGSGVKQAGTKDCYIIAGVDGVKDAGRDVTGNTIIATGKGIETGSGLTIANNNIDAGSTGIQTGNSCEVTGNTVVAVGSAVNAFTGSNIFGNPLLKSTGASAVVGSVYKDVINNVIITTSNNASHHGITTNNAQTHHILNNYIEVANAGANGIVQAGGSTFVYSAGNTFKGMTTPLNLSNGNQQTNSEDSTGSILIG